MIKNNMFRTWKGINKLISIIKKSLQRIYCLRNRENYKYHDKEMKKMLHNCQNSGNYYKKKIKPTARSFTEYLNDQLPVLL